jgi:hypothetical protein
MSQKFVWRLPEATELTKKLTEKESDLRRSDFFSLKITFYRLNSFSLPCKYKVKASNMKFCVLILQEKNLKNNLNVMV